MRRFSATEGAANFAACSALAILLAVQSALGAGVAQITVGPQAAPTTQQTAVAPPSTPTKSKYESIEFNKRPPQQPSSTPTQLISSDSSMLRVAGALGVVLGCIFIVRWAGKKILGLQTTRDSSAVIQVLCRIPVSPRQQLMLIQIGRKMILVANCATSMNSLCEITDPDEIAALAGQLQQRRRGSATSAFLGIFGKAGAKFEAQQETQETQETFPSPQINSDEETSQEPVEPELATTRAEMRGLMDRVHQLAQHYRRTTS